MRLSKINLSARWMELAAAGWAFWGVVSVQRVILREMIPEVGRFSGTGAAVIPVGLCLVRRGWLVRAIRGLWAGYLRCQG